MTLVEAEAKTARKIVTNYWLKPIPLRQFDWFAWFDDDEPNDVGYMMGGHGATEQEAIAELVECWELEQ